MVTEIVVLGGGYAGVWSARTVLRAVRAGTFDQVVRVRLVSAAPEHSFHGWTAEVITGHVRPHRARVPLSRLLPGIEIVHGEVIRVDPVQRTVAVRTRFGLRRLPYDQLVVGLGSRDAVEKVPGLAEHAWSLKDPLGLAALRKHLATLASTHATIVVAGAGLTGVEAATAIAQRLPSARVLLAHPGERPLPMLRPRFGRIAEYAAREAERAGVQFVGATRLIRVTADGAELEGYGFVASSTVVTTIGQAPVVLPGLEGFARDSTGRLITDRFLRIAPGIWAGGDVAAVPHPSNAAPCPANALWAIHHGKRIGANLVRVLGGHEPRPFRFPGLGQGASLGVGRGAAELYGVQLTGWPAWLARWFFFHWFMPSRRVALATAAEWLRPPSDHAVRQGADRVSVG